MTNVERIKAISKWLEDFVSKAKFMDIRNETWLSEGQRYMLASFVPTGEVYNGYPELTRIEFRIIKGEKACTISVEDRISFTSNINVSIDMGDETEVLTFEQLYLDTKIIMNNYKAATDGVLEKYYSKLYNY